MKGLEGLGGVALLEEAHARPSPLPTPLSGPAGQDVVLSSSAISTTESLQMGSLQYFVSSDSETS